jgi:hypothetical protein
MFLFLFVFLELLRKTEEEAEADEEAGNRRKEIYCVLRRDGSVTVP